MIARLTNGQKEVEGTEKIVGERGMGERGYEKMTVAQLKDELRKQKKPLTGKKADLVARLMENGGQVGVKRKSPVKEKRKKPVNPSPIRLRPEEERAYNGYSVGRLRKMLTERKIEGRSKLTTRKKITERLVQWDREQI